MTFPTSSPLRSPVLARAALEAWGLEAFRQRRFSEYQLRTLLGLPSRWNLHALFKERKVEMYALEEFANDLVMNDEFRKNHPVGKPDLINNREGSEAICRSRSQNQKPRR